MKKLILFIIIISSLGTSCTKNEFDSLELHDELYTSRPPLKILGFSIYLAPGPFLTTNSPYVSAAWKMDQKFLQDFYPGYEVKMYLKSGSEDQFITNINDAEGDLTQIIGSQLLSSQQIIFKIFSNDEVIYSIVDDRY